MKQQPNLISWDELLISCEVNYKDDLHGKTFWMKACDLDL